jgi:hypothetical protein
VPALALRPVVACGALGVVSGVLTPHLSDLFRAFLPDWTIVGVPLSMWLAGIAFGIALAAASAWLVRFQPRQLLFIPFVLLGWFAAVQICVSMGVDEPKPYAQTLPGGESAGCIRLSDQECIQLFPARAETEASRAGRYWHSLGAYVMAGAVGALITAVGIPFATGCRLSRPSLLAITLTGAAVAAAWFVLASSVAAMQADQYWYALFVPWQAAVAAVIGYSISGKTATSQN